MRNLMPITRPMGAADLTQAAEDAGRYALALSDLSRAVAAYEAATGAAIAVVDADKVEMVEFDMASEPDETVFGSLDKTARRAVEEYVNMDHAQIYRDAMVTGTGFMRDGKRIDPAEVFADDELLDAMYPQPVPEAGTVEDAVMAGAAAVADLISESASRVVVAVESVVEAKRAPQPASTIKKDDNALPKWNGKTIPAELRDAVQHLAEIGTSGPKWGFQQDHEMIERAIDGQTEKLIADVMEFSQSHIRQRFSKLVDRIHARGNSFTREQIRDALQWMLGKTHTA